MTTTVLLGDDDPVLRLRSSLLLRAAQQKLRSIATERLLGDEEPDSSKRRDGVETNAAGALQPSQTDESDRPGRELTGQVLSPPVIRGGTIAFAADRSRQEWRVRSLLLGDGGKSGPTGFGAQDRSAFGASPGACAGAKAGVEASPPSDCPR